MSGCLSMSLRIVGSQVVSVGYISPLVELVEVYSTDDTDIPPVWFGSW